MGLVMLAMIRKPSRRFRDEEHESKEEDGNDEQNCDGNLVAMTIADGLGIVVDNGANQSADVLGDLIHRDHDSSKMGRCAFRNVQNGGRNVDTVSEADKETSEVNRAF